MFTEMMGNVSRFERLNNYIEANISNRSDKMKAAKKVAKKGQH